MRLAGWSRDRAISARWNGRIRPAAMRYTAGAALATVRRGCLLARPSDKNTVEFQPQPTMRGEQEADRPCRRPIRTCWANGRRRPSAVGMADQTIPPAQSG